MSADTFFVGMDVPAVVESALSGESVAAHIPLRGEDALYVTGTRTLAYRADGLLSDESVDEYRHDAERITVSEGRRKSKITLDYGLDGEATVSVPSSKLDDALHPILAGVLNHAGVTQAGETVKRTYRFSELTLVVTSDRLVKHIGAAVWDDDFEEIAFADVTDVGVEEGSVSSQLVLETTGRTQRIKAPNESFRDVRETVEDALFAAHDARTYEEFRHAVAAATPEEEVTGDVAFDSDLEPLGGRDEPADESETAETRSEPASSTSAVHAEPKPTESEPAESEPVERVESTEPRVDVDALRAELDDLEATVDRQRELLSQQRDLIETQADLIEEQDARLDALRDATPDR